MSVSVRKLGTLALVAVVVGMLALESGCTRRFFRKRADNEVAQVLAEKDKYPFWKIEQYHVYPDGRARFADPTNPDRPPMPPDDPAAQELGPNPQRPGKAGVALIEGTGYLDMIKAWDTENRGKLGKGDGGPGELATITFEEEQDKGGKEVLPPPRKIPEKYAADAAIDKGYLLTLDQTVELGLVNSRDYQSRREDLYLAALAVTLQRFSFAAHFFATNETVRTWAGRLAVGGPQNKWDINSTAGFSKLFSTGALLLLRFANQTVIDLTGNLPRHTTSVTTLNLDLVQPLLRGGGRAVTLEPLTQTERDLLYEIRDFARFRKGFYVGIATGGDFDAFNVQPVRGGYLPTLRNAAQVDIENRNVARLQEYFKLFQGFEEGGEVSQVQVDQVASDLLQGQTRVLTQQQQLRDSVDRLKQTLGLPVPLPLELDDRPLRPISDHMKGFETILEQFKAVVSQIEALEAPEEAPKLRTRFKQAFVDGLVVQGTQFRKVILSRWAAWEKDKLGDKQLEQKLREMNAERRKLLDAKTDAEVEGKALPEAQQRRLEELERETGLGGLEQSLRRYEAEPWKGVADARKQADLRGVLFRDVLNGFVLVLDEARNERFAQMRQRWPGLYPVTVDGFDLLAGDLNQAMDFGAQAALANRLDIMNARAQLVDAWRQIAVSANSLLGTFDVGYHLSSSSPTGAAQPLLLDGSRLRHQLALNTELPLVRVAERNFYRATLIAYQRARRNLMATEDRTVASLRQTIRQLRTLAETYKIQQKRVELAYRTVEGAFEQFRAPVPPGGQREGPAALTNQLLSAQNGLVQNQGLLLTTWNNYLISRLQLYRDLELMPLDFRGVWIDELANPEPGPGGNDLSDAGNRRSRQRDERTFDFPAGVPAALSAAASQR